MKYPFTPYILLLLAATGSAFPAIRQSTAPSAHPSERYVSCTVQSKEDPAKALQEATQWLEQGGALSAQHCQALALFNLRQYEAAATALEGLAKAIGPDQLQLQVNVLQQAAYARRLAKQMLQAANNYDAALATAYSHRLDPLAIALLYDRVTMFRELGQNLRAIQDLDNILSLNDKETSALIIRALIFQEMGQSQLARQDAEAVLAIEPSNAEAKAFLSKLGR